MLKTAGLHTHLEIGIQNDMPEVGKNILEFKLDESLMKRFHDGYCIVKMKEV